MRERLKFFFHSFAQKPIVSASPISFFSLISLYNPPSIVLLGSLDMKPKFLSIWRSSFRKLDFYGCIKWCLKRWTRYQVRVHLGFYREHSPGSLGSFRFAEIRGSISLFYESGFVRIRTEHQLPDLQINVEYIFI